MPIMKRWLADTVDGSLAMGLMRCSVMDRTPRTRRLRRRKSTILLVIARYELVDDSDGAGKYRGGLGLRRDYCFDHEVSFTILADRDKWGPWGLFGGDAGEIARYTLNPDAEATKLGSKVTVQLKPGDIMRVESCGGGGLRSLCGARSCSWCYRMCMRAR